MTNRDTTGPSGAMGQTFQSPQEALPEIRRMLRAEDWPALAGFYDLSQSELNREDLESGNFFIERDTRALGQPTEVTRYRHPFAPAFEFSHLIRTNDPDVVVVEMSLSIDQGEGAPPQRALTWFKMKRTTDDWKILPDIVSEEETRGEPITRDQ